MTEKLSDEARREAVKRAYLDAYSHGRVRDRYDADLMMAGFEDGAEWQAARDRECITELEAEVERYRLAHDIVCASTATAEEIGQSVSTVAQVIARTDAIAWREQGRELDAEVKRLRGRLTGIKERDAEVGEDESWWIGGAWGEYGEAVVPLRILSYVIDGNLDEKVASIDPGFALTYAEQVARADAAEAKLARIREFVTEHSVGPDDPFAYGQQVARRVLEILDGDNT